MVSFKSWKLEIEKWKWEKKKFEYIIPDIIFINTFLFYGEKKKKKSRIEYELDSNCRYIYDSRILWTYPIYNNTFHISHFRINL